MSRGFAPGVPDTVRPGAMGMAGDALVRFPDLDRMESPRLSIKELRHDDRVARQAVSREQRSDGGSERVSRGNPKQGGKGGILDDAAQHDGLYGRKCGEEL